MIAIQVLAAVGVLSLATPTPAPGATSPATSARIAVSAELAQGDEVAEAAIAEGSVDEKDAPEVEEILEAQSAEIDEVRAAEEKAALLPAPRPEEGAAEEAFRLGSESPIRHRLDGALSRDTAPAPEEEVGTIAMLPEVGHDLARLQSEYDIPIDVNESVVAYVRFFQSPKVRRHFVRWLGRLARYQDRYRTILREEGLPTDTIYLAMIESGFANLATSRARAVGPWQFIASTGKRMGLKQDFWVDERRDPEKSARAAATYLRELHNAFGDWRLAWAGYNAGEGKIYKAQRKGQLDFWTMAHGKVLKRETKGYVPKLMAAAIISKHPEAFGFRPEEIEAERWTEYEEVHVGEAVSVDAIAQAAGVTSRELHELNPELRRSSTPPRGYKVKLPRGTATAFQSAWPSMASAARMAFASHTVLKGEGVAVIAAAYGVPADTVLRLNGLKAGRRVKPGTEIVIPLAATARRNGAPATEAVARARIEDLQKKNPRLVESEPPPAPAKRAAGVLAVAAGAPVRVTIQAGDTLWSIAQKFGVAVADLCRWNGIRDPRKHKLQVGRELVVNAPAVEAAPVPARAG